MAYNINIPQWNFSPEQFNILGPALATGVNQFMAAAQEQRARKIAQEESLAKMLMQQEMAKQELAIRRQERQEDAQLRAQERVEDRKFQLNMKNIELSQQNKKMLFDAYKDLFTGADRRKQANEFIAGAFKQGNSPEQVLAGLETLRYFQDQQTSIEEKSFKGLMGTSAMKGILGPEAGSQFDEMIALQKQQNAQEKEKFDLSAKLQAAGISPELAPNIVASISAGKEPYSGLTSQQTTGMAPEARQFIGLPVAERANLQPSILERIISAPATPFYELGRSGAVEKLVSPIVSLIQRKPEKIEVPKTKLSKAMTSRR